MNLNILFTLMSLAFAIAMFLLAYLYGWRGMRKVKRCTAKTTGKVVRFSLVSYNGYSLPVVHYAVDGKPYKVVGPNFKAGVTKIVSAPLNDVVSEVTSNIDDAENLPDVLMTKVVKNNNASITMTPLRELFPIGKEVDVYYNPKKPKDAYVIRYAAPYKFISLWLPLILGIIFLAAAVYFAMCPMFPM